MEEILSKKNPLPTPSEELINWAKNFKPSAKLFPDGSSAIQKIAEVVKNKKQKYLNWLKLPRYQEETSDEYYADIQAITEDLQKVIDFIDSNFSA